MFKKNKIKICNEYLKKKKYWKNGKLCQSSRTGTCPQEIEQ